MSDFTEMTVDELLDCEDGGGKWHSKQATIELRKRNINPLTGKKSTYTKEHWDKEQTKNEVIG